MVAAGIGSVAKVRGSQPTYRGERLHIVRHGRTQAVARKNDEINISHSTHAEDIGSSGRDGEDNRVLGTRQTIGPSEGDTF